MDHGELPVWLADTAFDAVLQRPRLGPELLLALRGLHAGIWHGSARLTPYAKAGAAEPVNVSAQTTVLPSGAIVTLVLLGLQRPVTDRPRLLRTQIRAYSARFSDEKWARTRWFLSEVDGSLAELKLQSSPDRRIWFLQEFSVL